VGTLSKGFPAKNCLKEIVYDLGKAAGRSSWKAFSAKNCKKADPIYKQTLEVDNSPPSKLNRPGSLEVSDKLNLDDLSFRL